MDTEQIVRKGCISILEIVVYNVSSEYMLGIEASDTVIL